MLPLGMDYFKRLLELVKMEREEDKNNYLAQTQTSTVAERRSNGLAWYPIAIKGTELGRADYLTVEVERPSNTDIAHQFRFGVSVALFSNHNAATDRLEGSVTYVGNNRMKISLRTDELPDWARDGKLGVDLLFDDNTYDEMQQALKLAITLAEKKEKSRLIAILTGAAKPTFDKDQHTYANPKLNAAQQQAVDKIIQANELAIVHGPPGTGKTTTLVQAIKTLIKQNAQKILVIAPSNTAVDLLSEKLSEEGLNVLRVGNPAKVSERLMALTLDSKMQEHSGIKEIKRLKKQASEFKEMAHKYKRSFGKAEREQRKALFDEAYKIMKEVGNVEQYIIDDVVGRAQVIAATPVGANHYTVRNLEYHTVVIDEAGQALEPACWIPILKAQKVILAGDHCQLPPTIKSEAAAKGGLSLTLLEKCIALHPEAVALLNIQYRMNELIMGYSSKVFYNNLLSAHPSVAGHTLSETDGALAFVDTAGCGFDEKTENVSISNPEEAALLLKHLTQLVDRLASGGKTTDFPTIAVISPYREQIIAMKELMLHSPTLMAYKDKIAINTIDSFQGQERDVVYISMTRSNANNTIGFLSDIRRMNVAMTRARKKLVVVGDSATLSRLPFYANFIAYAEENGAYASAWEYMDM